MKSTVFSLAGVTCLCIRQENEIPVSNFNRYVIINSKASDNKDA